MQYWHIIKPKQKAHIGGGGIWGRIAKCGFQEANHWHIFWACPVIKPFWAELHKALESIFNSPAFATFYIILRKCWFSGKTVWFHILMSAGKKNNNNKKNKHSQGVGCFLNPHTIQEWTDIVNDIYVMEKITFSLCLRKNVFIKFWTKWVEYLKPLQTDFV